VRCERVEKEQAMRKIRSKKEKRKEEWETTEGHSNSERK